MQRENKGYEIGDIIIQLHDIARSMEQKASLSMRQEAYNIRKIADTLSSQKKRVREEEYND